MYKLPPYKKSLLTKTETVENVNLFYFLKQHNEWLKNDTDVILPLMSDLQYSPKKHVRCHNSQLLLK